MENWQDEIIKAQISQEIGVERSMENSDISIFLKSFKENLIGAVDRDSFDKRWSSDLQSKFPNGSWRTVNGARVFINNGKVVAGLDGFNGEIDKFFESRGKKESGKPHKDKNGVETYEGNVSFNALSEKDKRVAYDNGIKSGEVGGSFQEFKQVFKDEEISEELISPDYAKESPKKEGKLSEREQEMLDAYKKDKKAFLKKNIDSSIRLGSEKTLAQLNEWIDGATNKEYKDMLNEVKRGVEEKLAEPKNTMNSFKEAEDKLKRFVGENEEEIDLDKFLQGDVVENFKEYKAYETAAKKAEKAGNAVVWGEMIQMPLIEGKEVKLPKKDIKVKVSKTIEDAISGVLSKDELRPLFHGVYNDPDGYKVATDANSLIAVKTDIGENSGKTINPKTGKEIEGKFPNWKDIVPERFDGEKKFSLSDIHSTSKQANYIQKQNPTSYMKLDGIPQSFFPEIMNKTIESLRKLGVEDVTIGYSDHNGKAILIKGKTNKGEDVQALVMPTMVMDESKVLTLK